jgi:hypothetical protein
MITKIQAILSLVPNAQVVVRGEEVEWYEPSVAPITEEQIQEEMVRLQAEAQAAVEAQAAAKQSALNKLMALGLTEEEALALGVK